MAEKAKAKESPMLTRLKINGFKNLVDVDVHFGPFTCVAGANGVGKSNLFDAIRLLSALAGSTLEEAARHIRDEKGRTSDIRHLFRRAGDTVEDRISLEAEMLLPPEAIDDLGQKAKAAITFVSYGLVLAHRRDHFLGLGSLEVIEERLDQINISEALRHIFFKQKPVWRKSVLAGRRTSPLISTAHEGGKRIIRLHQDGGGRGKAKPFLAESLPRTVLSSVNALESPTALVARREMQSWKFLQLEPSALREPDSFTTPPGIESNGARLAATLYHLARLPVDGLDSRAYEQVAGRLAELIDDVREVAIDRDEKRELLTLMVKAKDDTFHPARSLSDGTLRFLALAVFELDGNSGDMLCLEEPENGIHPDRIPAMIRLLTDIATDTEEPVGPDNPLRQVIINTHSPSVVRIVPDDALLVAKTEEMELDGRYFTRCVLGCLPHTWREKTSSSAIISKSELISYLSPVPPPGHADPAPNVRRVMDRKDFRQMSLPLIDEGE